MLNRRNGSASSAVPLEMARVAHDRNRDAEVAEWPNAPAWKAGSRKRARVQISSSANQNLRFRYLPLLRELNLSQPIVEEQYFNTRLGINVISENMKQATKIMQKAYSEKEIERLRNTLKDVEEAKKDPRFRKAVKEFIKATT